MQKHLVQFLALFTIVSVSFSKVEFKKSDAKVEVVINGQSFANYLFAQDQPKPILVPLKTPSGIEVNRRFPLTPLEGGSDDHPHHIGLFFAVDQVNGTNFWKNTKTSPQIRHVSIDAMEEGDSGTLSATSLWIDEQGKEVLKESRTMIFSGDARENRIDVSIDLTALQPEVTFKDIEEGMFAIRLADALRESGSKVIPPPGQPLPEETVSGTGQYFTSNGDVGAKEGWGKRARWVALQGVKSGKVVGLAMMNHPESINYPTFWHIRGYGLFSANPLGQGDFLRQSKYKKNPVLPLNLTLKQGESIHFRFLVIIFDGRRTSQEMEKTFKDFVSQ